MTEKLTRNSSTAKVRKRKGEKIIPLSPTSLAYRITPLGKPRIVSEESGHGADNAISEASVGLQLYLDTATGPSHRRFMKT